MLKMNTFENVVFTVIVWNMLENDIRNSESVSAFKRRILKFNRQSPNSPNTFNMQNPHEIKLLTRVGLGHLHEQKFRNNFKDYPVLQLRSAY